MSMVGLFTGLKLLNTSASHDSLRELHVKNGFSDLTKAQEVMISQEKNVMNRHRGKALTRAVVKEEGSDGCLFKEKINNIGT